MSNFESFGPFQTPLWIFLIFCMEVVLMVLFQKTILYKILILWNLVHLRPFLAKIDSFESFFTYIFQTPLWIFPIFGMEVVLMVFFEKIMLCMPRKFKDVQNFAIFDQMLALLWVFSLYFPTIVTDLSSLTSLNFDSFRGNQSYCVLLLVFF